MVGVAGNYVVFRLDMSCVVPWLNRGEISLFVSIGKSTQYFDDTIVVVVPFSEDVLSVEHPQLHV